MPCQSTNPLDSANNLQSSTLRALSPDLPIGWERYVDPDGKQYFFNFDTRTTTWDDPKLEQPLPRGWSQRVGPDGRQYFVNQHTNTTTWDDLGGAIASGVTSIPGAVVSSSNSKSAGSSSSANAIAQPTTLSSSASAAGKSSGSLVPVKSYRATRYTKGPPSILGSAMRLSGPSSAAYDTATYSHGSVGPVSKPAIPRESYIIRSVPMPPEAVAVMGRVPQFPHLTGPALYAAIDPLPDWQKLLELQPWFTIIDIALFYLHTVEGFTFPRGQEKRTSARLKQMGFSGPGGLKMTIHRRVREHNPAALKNGLAFLLSHKPPVSNLPPGLPRTTFNIAGPVQCTYTLLNSPLPLKLVDPTAETPVHNTACISALMHLILDDDVMIFHITTTYVRLRAVHPTLLPWGPGQKITDTNPELANSWLAENCVQPFWAKGYEDKMTPATGFPNIHVWCHEHQRFEHKQIPKQLLL